MFLSAVPPDITIVTNTSPDDSDPLKLVDEKLIANTATYKLLMSNSLICRKDKNIRIKVQNGVSCSKESWCCCKADKYVVYRNQKICFSDISNNIALGLDTFYNKYELNQFIHPCLQTIASPNLIFLFRT